MMATFKVLFLVALFCLGALVTGQQENPSTEKPVTIILKSENEASKGTPTPILENVDKKNKTTTSTTTTVAPTTTTAAPTTTTAAPTTTTVAPTTTTVAPTTTPPPPAPPGPPELGVWSYTNSSNVTCVMVQFTASINISYVRDSKNVSHVIINVPVKNTSIDGECGNLTQWITVSWPNDTKANSFSMYFHKNESTHQYHLSTFNVSLTVDRKLFPNISTDVIHLQHSTEEWEVPLQASYRCAATSQLSMADAVLSSSVGAIVTLTRLQEQAFRTTPDKTFSAARDCGGNDLPDAVPIAVGCALGGLVVVVLVAYLVGRRRSAARGYLSM